MIEPRRGIHVRYGKNLHELRDLFRTRWEKSGARGAAAEFFMGHVVDPLDYNKAYRDEAFARAQYLEAEPWLNVVSEEPSKVDVGEVRSLRHQLDDLESRLEKRDREWEERLRRAGLRG